MDLPGKRKQTRSSEKIESLGVGGEGRTGGKEGRRRGGREDEGTERDGEGQREGERKEVS